MRRFIDTLAGKALCQLAAMALVLPTITLGVAGRAEAQVTQLPSWAVTEFKDLKGNASLKYGQAAADAVASELAKTNKYDVVGQDTVKRSIETLGLSSPLDGIVNLTRVGQDARAGTIVTGEVLDYQVRAAGGGKEAIVALRAVAYDVAGGVPVNGALEKGESTIRGNNVANDVLINDAIAQAAAVAVRTMQAQTTPTATVLNTTEQRALINQGSRAGFRTGDTVVISRGSEQIGTGRVGDLEADQAEITPERRSGHGIAPGDKVRGVFNPPALPPLGYDVIKANGDISRAKSGSRRGSNNATLISALLVVGLLAVLLGSGGNSNSTTPGSATAEATIDANGVSPGVQITWTPNGFYKGNNDNGPKDWQIYRPQDVPSNPIAVVNNGNNLNFYVDAVDTARATSQGYFSSDTLGGNTCNTNSTTSTFANTDAPALTPGVPYFYQVAAVYTVSQRDLPSSTTGSGGTAGASTASTGTTATAGGTGTTTGTTASTGTTGTSGSTASTASTGTTASTGGTGSTAGTTAGSTTSTTGDSLCYFISGRATTGRATAIARPTLLLPANAAPLSNSDPGAATVNFTFSFAQANAGGVTPAYVIEFSTDSTFRSNTLRVSGTSAPSALSFNVPTLGSNFTGTKVSGGGTLATAGIVYYRVGVRNATDSPGPVKDPFTKQRYIYSTARYFTRATNPPGSPSAIRKRP